MSFVFRAFVEPNSIPNPNLMLTSFRQERIDIARTLLLFSLFPLVRSPIPFQTEVTNVYIVCIPSYLFLMYNCYQTRPSPTGRKRPERS
jgi:hypothetical protein